LPQIVLPDLYGADGTGSFRLVKEVQLESSAAAYAGVVATLFLAPLAWASRRHRTINVFWILISLLSLSWCLNLPGLVSLLRLPGLNLMSHNRFVFVASFAFLAMATVGLEVLLQGPVTPRWWFWLPAAMLTALSTWCAYRVLFPPEQIDTELGLAILRKGAIGWIHDLDGVSRVQRWFVLHYAVAALLCGIGVAGWISLWYERAKHAWLLPLVGAVLMGDLLWFGYGRNAQCDPALYFPPIPVLEAVAKSAPGRIMGIHCLPASLAAMCGLRDIRGYDSVDPARFVDLMRIGGNIPSWAYRYALTQELTPKVMFTDDGDIRLSPVLNMLGVRYVIGRGSPHPNTHPAFQGPDYWAIVNSNALARTFIPHRVETVTDDKARLAKLAAEEFNPREVAYVESPLNLPGPAQGVARIVEEIPTRIVVSVRMETPGLVVLADLWDKGWQAYWNGERVPILRTNHAIRGVVVPAGSGTLEFRYAPASFALGLRLAGLALMALLAWLGVILWKRRSALTLNDL
jgi:hypothetical protein